MTRSLIWDALCFSQIFFLSGNRRMVVGRLSDGRRMVVGQSSDSRRTTVFGWLHFKFQISIGQGWGTTQPFQPPSSPTPALANWNDILWKNRENILEKSALNCKIIIISNFKFQLARAGSPLWPMGVVKRQGRLPFRGRPQPWPIEIWSFKKKSEKNGTKTKTKTKQNFE